MEGDGAVEAARRPGHLLRGWACLLPNIYKAPLASGGRLAVPECKLFSRERHVNMLPTSFLVPRHAGELRRSLLEDLLGDDRGGPLEEPVLPDEGDSLSLDIVAAEAEWPRLTRGGHLVLPARSSGVLTIGAYSTGTVVAIGPARLPVARPE